MRGRTTGPASVQPQPRAACTSDSTAARACPRPRTGSGGMISAAPPGTVAPAFRRTTGPASVQPQPRAACTSDSTAARACPRPRTGSGGMISAVFAQAKGMAAWQPAGLRFPVHPPKAQGRPGRLARGRATVCSLRLCYPRKDSPGGLLPLEDEARPSGPLPGALHRRIPDTSGRALVPWFSRRFFPGGSGCHPNGHHAAFPAFPPVTGRLPDASAFPCRILHPHGWRICFCRPEADPAARTGRISPFQRESYSLELR